MKGAAAFAVAIAVANTAHAEPVTFWSPGSSGGTSCATWLSNYVQEAAGGQWVLGFFTGANAHNNRNHFVGHSTDSAGLVAEVKAACQAAPSETVQATTFKVYYKLQAERR
jgi:hypothetical protein